MPLVVPDISELILMGYIQFNLTGGSVWRLRLFQNNYIPVNGTLVANFTEATFSGYAAQTVPNFGSPSTVSNKAKIVAASACVFSHNGGGTSNTVYGYYFTDSTGVSLILAERFAAPIVMASSGDTISITPELTLFSDN